MNDRCAVHPHRPAEHVCVRCGAAACDMCSGQGDATVCAACSPLVGGRRDAVSLVPTLGWLCVGHGVLIGLLGGFYASVAVLYVFLPGELGSDRPLAIGLLGTIGGAHLIAAALQVVAGVHLRRYRRRRFAMVALASGFATVLGCYCLMTALPLGVWGLMLLTNSEVRLAFERRAR